MSTDRRPAPEVSPIGKPEGDRLNRESGAMSTSDQVSLSLVSSSEDLKSYRDALKAMQGVKEADTGTKYGDSATNKMAELREALAYSSGKSEAAGRQYVARLTENPAQAVRADVETIHRLAEGGLPFACSERHRSEAAQILLTIAAKGLTEEIRSKSAEYFKSIQFADLQDVDFKNALLKYAQTGHPDPLHKNQIKRYAWMLDGEKQFYSPSKFDNALVFNDKEIESKRVSDAPPVSRRRDETVIAVEKVMPSYANLAVTKTDSFGGIRDTVGASIAIDERGYYLTARHVVKDARTISISGKDDVKIRARVVAEIPDRDLAVLKVEKRVPETRLGPAARSDLMLGERVIAIGNPFGFKTTVSGGILSTKERDITMPDGGPTLRGIIQVDIGVNPGNSGGPLINRDGELIGIVCAVREGTQMMAFAVNADDAQRELAVKMSAEKMAGITHGITARQRILKEDGPERQQVIAHKTSAPGPAGEAGIKDGDVITSINGKRIMNLFDVERAFWSEKAGNKVAVEVLRNGETIKLELRPKRATKGSK